MYGFFFFFYCLILCQLPATGPKVGNIPKNKQTGVFTLLKNRTMVQFDRDRGHLFWWDYVLVLWSEETFTPLIMVLTKLMSPKVQTKTRSEWSYSPTKLTEVEKHRNRNLENKPPLMSYEIFMDWFKALWACFGCTADVDMAAAESLSINPLKCFGTARERVVYLLFITCGGSSPQDSWIHHPTHIKADFFMLTCAKSYMSPQTVWRENPFCPLWYLHSVVAQLFPPFSLRARPPSPLNEDSCVCSALRLHHFSTLKTSWLCCKDKAPPSDVIANFEVFLCIDVHLIITRRRRRSTGTWRLMASVSQDCCHWEEPAVDRYRLLLIQEADYRY